MAVIMSNPEQSKHLETARMKVGEAPAAGGRAAARVLSLAAQAQSQWLASYWHSAAETPARACAPACRVPCSIGSSQLHRRLSGSVNGCDVGTAVDRHALFLQVRGIWIDLVNLRSEEYALHSRIPTMTVRARGWASLGDGKAGFAAPAGKQACSCTAQQRAGGAPASHISLHPSTTARMPFCCPPPPPLQFGTPEEDAHRRDFTINTLFYNINTGLIEDFTQQ